MHKKQNKEFNNTDSKDRLKEIFKSISKAQKHYYSNKTALFSKYPVLFIMSEILDLVQIPINPYKVNYLIELYENFDFNSEKRLFTIDDLFYDGWLIRFIDEWYFNGWKNKINKIEETNNKRINQIIEFLKELAKIPYEDERYLTIDVNSERFYLLISKIGINLSELVDLGILSKNEDYYYIDSKSDIWSDWGCKVLSEKLNKWMFDNEGHVYEHWIDICAHLQNCWRPEIDVEDISKLYNVCLDYLEQESSTWEQIERILEKYYQIDRHNILKVFGIIIPENPRERFDYLRRNEEKYMIFRTRSKTHDLFYLCVRNYNRVNDRLRYRFRSLLNLPLYNLYYFHMGFQMEECAVDCLYETDLFYEPAMCLRNRIGEAAQTGIISDAKMLWFVKGLWEVIRAELLLFNINDMPVHKVIEFLLFLLYDEEHKKNNLIYKNSSYLEMFDNLILLYDKDIPYGTDAERHLFNHIVDLIKNTHNYICTYYLILLIRLSDSYKYDKSYYAKEMYGVVYDGFCEWFNNAVEDDLSLSVIPKAFFSLEVWKNIFEQNYKSAVSFFDMFKRSKEKISYAIKKDPSSALLKEGKLSVIYLYLGTIWLNELKDNISEMEYIELEKRWIYDFFDLHYVFELFSGEHINMLKSDYVINRCMEVVSKFSSKGKQLFKKKIMSISAADLIFWLEFIDLFDIKNSCLKIIATADPETLTKSVVFIPTEVQLMKKLGDICWELYNKKKSGDLNKEYANLVNLLKSVLANLHSVIEKRQNLQDDYQQWLESMDNVILILEDREDEVLNGDSDFYKGLVCLSSEKLEDLRRAVEFYEDYYHEGLETGSINYMIALSLLICRLDMEGYDYTDELTLFKDANETLMISIQNMERENISEVYYYSLLVYCTIGDAESFLNLADKIPDEYKTKLDSAEIILTQYAKEGETVKARQLIDKLKEKYGENESVSKFEEMIAADRALATNTNIFGQKQIIKLPTQSPELISNIRNALRTIPSLDMLDTAEVFSHERVATGEFEKYRTDELKGIVVVHLLTLLFKSVISLQEYRPYLIFQEKTAEEDTYNATLRRFFNMIVPDCVGYKMIDQSQGGTTGNIHKNGEMGKGERDLIITRGSQEIMLLEGMKLDSVNKGVIREHIEKIDRYNSYGMSLAAIPIYTDAQNIAALWDGYTKYLEEIKENGQCNMIDIVTEFDWKSVRLEWHPLMVCRTTHFYPNSNLNVHIYHILIRVGTK